jgi:hypothetical protein
MAGALEASFDGLDLVAQGELHPGATICRGACMQSSCPFLGYQYWIPFGIFHEGFHLWCSVLALACDADVLSSCGVGFCMPRPWPTAH